MVANFPDASGTLLKRESLAGWLSALIVSPGRWFAEIFPLITLRRSSGILLFASLFYAVMGGLSASNGDTLARVLILMINAVGMTGLCAAIAWLAAMIGSGPRLGFSRIWTVFAVATSPTLLIAWVPFAFFFTEPWKWWLIGIGLVHGLGITKARAVIIVLFTFGATVMMVLSLLPVVQQLAGR